MKHRNIGAVCLGILILSSPLVAQEGGFSAESLTPLDFNEIILKSSEGDRLRTATPQPLYDTLYNLQTEQQISEGHLRSLLSSYSKASTKLPDQMALVKADDGWEFAIPAVEEWKWRSSKVFANFDSQFVKASNREAENLDKTLKAILSNSAIDESDLIKQAKHQAFTLARTSAQIAFEAESDGTLGAIEKNNFILHGAASTRDSLRVYRDFKNISNGTTHLPPSPNDPLHNFSQTTHNTVKDRQHWGIPPDLGRLYYSTSRNCAGVTDKEGKIIGSGIFLGPRIFLTAQHVYDSAMSGNVDGEPHIVRTERLSSGEVTTHLSLKVKKSFLGQDVDPPLDYALLMTEEHPDAYTTELKINEKIHEIGDRLFLIGYPWPEHRKLGETEVVQDRELLMRVRNDCFVLLPETMPNDALLILKNALTDFYNVILSRTEKAYLEHGLYSSIDLIFTQRYRSEQGLMRNYYSGSYGEMPSLGLSGSIFKGDSGAGVFDHSTGAIVGIVILGQPSTELPPGLRLPHNPEEILPVKAILSSAQNKWPEIKEHIQLQ